MRIETKLAHICVDKGVSYRRLSVLSDVSESAIYKLAEGEKNINNSTLDVLVALADALNVPFTDIVEDNFLERRVRENIRRYGR